jgi:hypothetical protein
MTAGLWEPRRVGVLEFLAVLFIMWLHAHVAAAACTEEEMIFNGDGYCDVGTGHNTESCGWDGGDCCRQTCTNTAYGYCPGAKGYDCKNPDFSNTVDDFATQVGGRCEDMTSFCAIQTSSTCQYAAELLGLSDVTAGDSITNANKAPGCFLSSSGALRFNTDTLGSDAGGDTNVCIKCAAITTTTTTTTTPNFCNVDCKDAPLYTCSLHECHFVDQISFGGRGLSGTIPEAIGLALGATLTDTLRLDQNQLTGTIPSSLGSLTAVKTLCVREVSPVPRSCFVGLAAYQGTLHACRTP